MQKSNWKKCKLGDVISVKHGFAFKGAFFTEVPTHYILVTPGNFQIGGGFKDTKLKYYNGPIPQDYILKTGDVIVTMTDLSKAGDTLGYSALVPNFKRFLLLHNQRIGLIVLKNNEIEKNFIYWVMRSPHYHQYIVNTASGSTVKHTSPGRIENFEFFCPLLEEQKRIAEILGSLDDKIELLQKQNKTLEDMAKALFKSWFVAFDVVRAKQKGLPKADIMREYHLTDDLYDLFPSSFADSPLGPIPSGWEVKPLKDLASITAGKRPKQVKDIKDDNFFIPVYGGNGIKWWTNVSLYSTPIIITGRVGTLGKVYRIYEPVWVSDNALIFEVQKEHFEYLLYMLYTIDFNSFNRGSTQPLITQSDIKEILVVFGQDIVQKFHSIIVEYEKKINNNNRQIQTLTELRDSLLPRLISGKIRVLIH